MKNILSILVPSIAQWGVDWRKGRRWLQIPLPVVWACAWTAVLSALVFAGSERFVSEAVTLQSQHDVLIAARLNLVALQRNVDASLVAQQRFLLTRQYSDLFAARHELDEALKRLDTSHIDLHRFDQPGQSADLRSLLDREKFAVDEALNHAESKPAGGARRSLQSTQSELRLISQQISQEADRLETSIQAAADDVAQRLSVVWQRQRVGAGILTGVNLLLLSAWSARILRYFFNQANRSESLTRQAEQLEATVKDYSDELAALATYLQSQSEREKSRLARDLHDELGTLLIAAKLDVAWLQDKLGERDALLAGRLKKLLLQLDQSTQIKRRVIEDLRPSLLDHLGLIPALIWYVQQTCDRAALAHNLVLPSEPVNIDTDMGLVCYRIVQEALNNVIVHAHAKNVTVELHEQADGFVLAVTDDGCGIPESQSLRLAHGLAGMRHRATSHGGRLHVSSSPGRGTRVEAYLPKQAGHEIPRTVPDFAESPRAASHDEFFANGVLNQVRVA